MPNESIEVISEKVNEHTRRIEQLEDMTKETAAGAAVLLVISTKHSEQLEIIRNIVYGGLGLALTTIIGIFLKR